MRCPTGSCGATGTTIITTHRKIRKFPELSLTMYPNLKLQLWRSGIRQNRLAKILEIDETVLSKVMNGFRDPSPDLRLRIAQALQSDVEWLFERQESGHNGLPLKAATEGENC